MQSQPSETTHDHTVQDSFHSLGLPEDILKAISDVGYEKPSPIQAQTIPYLLEGRDLLGVAQTGTGKTAAFSLPLLSRLDTTQKHTQILCLAPTRELAIQVAEAFGSYAKYLKGFQIAAIYGGQDYRTQLKQLKKQPQVIVGTPGRVMDHMRRGSIVLDDLNALILDEADEMLRMGFIDDVEWVLEQTPATRQIALFSATMPSAIKRIAKQHLNDPAEITIKLKTTTAENIRQRYWQLNNSDKKETLVRLLDTEEHDGVIIFVRTKTATVEVAELLAAHGLKADALNGDMAQNIREKSINRLKKSQIDILVATDVAARGLDVERISHVINYDIPYDTESYVHRIGRTGRAGREGEAILFVNNREKRLLQSIERTTKQPIEKYRFPSTESLNERKRARFFSQLDTALGEVPEEYRSLLSEYLESSRAEAIDITAALAWLLNDRKTFSIKAPKASESGDKKGKRDRKEKRSEKPAGKAGRSRSVLSDNELQTCRIEVGAEHGAKKGNIVGAIANECDLESQYMGKIVINDTHSYIDLPIDMPRATFKKLQKVRVCGQPLKLSLQSTQKKPAGPSQIRKRKAHINKKAS